MTNVLGLENIFAQECAPLDSGECTFLTLTRSLFTTGRFQVKLVYKVFQTNQDINLMKIISMECMELKNGKKGNDDDLADLEEKSGLLSAKEKNVHLKSVSGKRKERKPDMFLWSRYLQVISRKFDKSDKILQRTNSHAAPVSAFPHAILNEYWDIIQPGLYVETYNLDSNCPVKLFWFANVKQIEGYKGLLR